MPRRVSELRMIIAHRAGRDEFTKCSTLLSSELEQRAILRGFRTFEEATSFAAGYLGEKRRRTIRSDDNA
jgi:hypothetical protein